MSKTGDIVTIKMTDDPDSSDFEYMAHRRGDTQKDVFYIGAYLGYVADNKLRSLSGKTPSNNLTIGNFRTYAQNNGTPTGNGTSGYDLFSFYQLTFIQAMYTLKYKNLNSQAVIGNGVSSGSSINTGGTETKGMDWGDTSASNQHMKLFGIEDLWGNERIWIDGVVIDGSYNVLTATQEFNDSNVNYANQGVAAPNGLESWPYITKICGTTEKGFIATTKYGSSTTYYCDLGDIYPSCVCEYGGARNGGEQGCYFAAFIHNSSSTANSIGTCLMYL